MTDDALASPLDERSLILGIDIGGTKTAAGVVTTDGRVLSFHAQPTPRDADAEGCSPSSSRWRRMLATAMAIRWRRWALAAAVRWSIPDGVVSPLFIPTWQSFPLRERITSVLGLPVVLDNDANAFALGEALFGAGRGTRALLGIVVSTGVGGGIVADSRLFHGATGNAGHIGHTIVSADGPRCSCGAIGCLTAYASGTGLVARAQAGIQQGEQTALAALSGNALTGQAIAKAATGGDAFAMRLMDDAGVALARGIVDAASLLDLESVILGGGLILAGDILMAPLRREVRDRARLPFTRTLDICTTTAGREAGVIGAAALCMQE